VGWASSPPAMEPTMSFKKLFSRIFLFHDFRVLFAFATNNAQGKQQDIHGRSYRQVYIEFGHNRMVGELVAGNSWHV
jgi:hypothetical protein